MEDESNATLQKIKRQAHSLGLALMGFSTTPFKVLIFET